MKRILLEWSLILSSGIAFSLFTLWLVSSFFDRSSYHLKVSTSGNSDGDCHFVLRDGHFSISNDFDVNPAGRAGPLIIDPKSQIKLDVARGDRFRQFTISGLDLRTYWNGRARFRIWSLELSLLIPVLLSLLAGVLFWCTLKRHRGNVTAASCGSL